VLAPSADDQDEAEASIDQHPASEGDEDQAVLDQPPAESSPEPAGSPPGQRREHATPGARACRSSSPGADSSGLPAPDPWEHAAPHDEFVRCYVPKSKNHGEAGEDEVKR
jgi:hypothetical protein